MNFLKSRKAEEDASGFGIKEVMYLILIAIFFVVLISLAVYVRNRIFK